jgi:citrate lyase subunit beta/citryl-CoA lyase
MNIETLKRVPPRSWLFVPALKAPEWLPKAIATGADGIILDLEDATAPDEKERASGVVAELGIAARERPAIVVRVNASPPELDRDVDAAVRAGADGVVLPKVEGPWQIRRCAWFLDEAETKAGTDRRLAILPMVETGRAVLRALDLADADERVASLMFGGGDLSAVVGWLRTKEGGELALARALVVLAASAAGIGAVDTPWLDIKDTAGARDESRTVRDMGFTGKFAIHPSHVAPIHEGFTPSEEEVADARGLLDAFEHGVAAGTGVTTYKGRMIDRPDALQAERVLARATRGRKGAPGSGAEQAPRQRPPARNG